MRAMETNSKRCGRPRWRPELTAWSAGLAIYLGLAVGTLPLTGCGVDEEEARDEIDDIVSADVTGQVLDNRGQALAGVTVRLYDLTDNEAFVVGHDISSAEAYIDKDAVLGSDNFVASAETSADGTFHIEGTLPSAFFAVASRVDCTTDFAGFDAKTGVLNLDTLIFPDLELNFEVPVFVLACADPPEVGPDGNTPDAPPFEPPAPDITCDADLCAAAGGTCAGDTCTITCVATSCAEAGGTCVSGECVLADCNSNADCTTAGGTCSADGSACELPECGSDADCEAGQPGAFCMNPGDLDLAACQAPQPGEIIPPAVASRWTIFRVTDTSDIEIADASTDNQWIPAASMPDDGLVRIYGQLDGSETTAYIHVQSGSQTCPDLPPRTDFIAVDLVDGSLASGNGNYVELFLHGGYQKISLSTSNVLGEGERSFVVEVGEACAPPQHPFVVILTWSAGPGEPADLDLSVWNGAGEIVYVGHKQAAWGELWREEGQGPGPEVFWGDDPSQGPFTIKVTFFSGRPRDVEAKVRIIRVIDGHTLDDTYVFTVSRPKDVAEIGVFASE